MSDFDRSNYRPKHLAFLIYVNTVSFARRNSFRRCHNTGHLRSSTLSIPSLRAVGAIPVAEHAQQIERDATIAMQDSKTRFVHDRLVHLLYVASSVAFLFSPSFLFLLCLPRYTSVLETSTTGLNALNDTRKRQPVPTWVLALDIVLPSNFLLFISWN